MPVADLRYQRKRRDPQRLAQYTESFKIEPKFVTRPWTFNPQLDADPESMLNVKQRMTIAAELVPFGLSGIELIYPYEINDDTIDYFEKYCEEASLQIKSVVLDYSIDPAFLHGALSSSTPKIRERALDLLKTAIELNDELETDYALIVLNSDGYETSFGMDLTAARDRVALAMVEVLDNIPEVRIAVQAAPNKWHYRQLFYSTGELLLLCQKVESLLTHSEHRERFIDGHTAMTVIPDLRFLPVVGEEPASSLSQILESARLAGVSLNFTSEGNHTVFEPGMDAGYLSSALYQLKMAGYQEGFHINLNSKTVAADQALKNAMDNLRAHIAFANYLDDEKIILSHLNPRKNKGWLDAYLIRAASPHGKALPPLDFFEI